MKKNDYLNLVEFWNQAFTLSDEDKKQILRDINPEEDYKQLAPSQKQFNALEGFKGFGNVLDYGCGTGWASIIMAKTGTKHVVAVDVASNSILMTDCYAEAFKVKDAIECKNIDENWLNQQKEGTFDGFFCSNVIDVVPLEMAKDIIENSSKVVKKNARVIFSLNYYVDPKLMEQRGCVIDGPHVYMNGVLRLTALKDEEWSKLFSPYYEIEKLDFFSWPDEEKETRRLFILRRK